MHSIVGEVQTTSWREGNWGLRGTTSEPGMLLQDTIRHIRNPWRPPSQPHVRPSDRHPPDREVQEDKKYSKAFPDKPLHEPPDEVDRRHDEAQPQRNHAESRAKGATGKQSRSIG